MELQQGERILEDVAANMFRGVEAVGGRMKITDRRIIFQPHAINLQTMPEEIPLDQVVDAAPRNTLLLIPNGMLIRLDSGVEYKFVVWKRSQLIEIIRKHMKR